jgi:SAM-dependent methyltransferase
LLGKLLWTQLQEAGLFANSPVGVAEWKERVKLPGLYEDWLAHSLEVLQGEGYLAAGPTGVEIVASKAVAAGGVWAEWAAYQEANQTGRRRAAVELVDATARALPAILRGERVATEVMFPESSMRLVEGIYKQNPVADYFNEVMAETLVGYVAQRLKQEAGARLRLLEIGAGTGGTSTLLWERLAPYAAQVEEYCYSDISKAFLQHAEKEYGAQVPYLRTALFDVEQAVAQQGLEVGAYDVVIATNVLHATRKLRETLRNAKALLKGQGVLLVNEMVGSSLFTHLTFGLLPGWWLFEDKELRVAGSPAVRPSTWEKLLSSEGFKRVSYPAAAWHELGQQIIVAESDGVVRQVRQAAAPVSARPRIQPEKLRDTQEQIAPTANPVANFEELLREKATTSLKKLVAQTLRMLPEQLDAYEPLETYGIDSILVVQITNVLRGAFENISSTLMFEHHSSSTS